MNNIYNYYNQNYSNRGLVIFISLQTINIIGLITDYCLYKTNNKTITELSLNYPILASSLCILQLTSPISLSMHFWYSAYNNFNHEENISFFSNDNE